MKGETDAAIAEFQRAIDLFPKSPGGVNAAEIRLGQAYAFWGRRDEATKILQKWNGWREKEQRSKQNYDVALIYFGLGERRRAFEILEQVYNDHDMNLLSIRTDPRLESIRSEPRYSDLMRRMVL